MTQINKDGMTSRDIKTASIRCDMCNGNGFSMFESTCAACAGDRVVAAPIYSDCGCPVELERDPDCELCFPAEEETIEAAA